MNKERDYKTAYENTMIAYNMLRQENEKLNHYKLLYQKVKERNEKTIEFVESFDIKRLHECMEHNLVNALENILEKLKGESNE